MSTMSNDPDVFRKSQNELDQRSKDQIVVVKDRAYKLLAEMKPPLTHTVMSKNTEAERLMTIAHERLEEAVMWAVKSLSV